VFSRNFTNKLNDVLEITTAAFTEISIKNWENYCKHVINVEEEYARKDIVIDQEMDNFVIELADDSSSTFIHSITILSAPHMYYFHSIFFFVYLLIFHVINII
jgi:hypothetical protein